MDLARAIGTHQAYKTRLSLWVSTGRGEAPDPGSCGREDRCELGRWILGEGAERFGQAPEFQSLQALHAQFHRRAAEVIRLAMRGERTAAEHLMERDLFVLSGEVVQAISRVKVLAGA